MAGALFVVRRMQEKHRDEERKLYMRFVDMEKIFYEVSRRVMEWTMKKKGLP